MQTQWGKRGRGKKARHETGERSAATGEGLRDHDNVQTSLVMRPEITPCSHLYRNDAAEVNDAFLILRTQAGGPAAHPNKRPASDWNRHSATTKGGARSLARTSSSSSWTWNVEGARDGGVGALADLSAVAGFSTEGRDAARLGAAEPARVVAFEGGTDSSAMVFRGERRPEVVPGTQAAEE